MYLTSKHAGLTLAGLLVLSACDKKDVEVSAQQDGAQAQSAEIEQAVEKASGGFAKEITKKACEVLTPELVAKTFDVPQGELKQMRVMGCIYSWNDKKADPPQTLEVSLIMMMAHKNEKMAQTWFENSTRNVSQDEAKDQIADVTKKAKEHEKVDTELKKKTTSKLGGLMAESVGKEGYQFEKIEGIFDEAKMGLHDGNLKVRVDNLTFSLIAYKGPQKPKLDIDPKDLKDIKGMTRKSMEQQRAWLEETMPERKKAVTKLAPLVAAKLSQM